MALSLTASQTALPYAPQVVILPSALEVFFSWHWRYVFPQSAIPPQTPLRFLPTTKKCQPTRALAAHGPMPLRARNACPPSRFPKRNRRPSAHLATGNSSRAWFCVQAHARRAVRGQRAVATSDAVFSIKEVDVRHKVDQGTPARMSILVGDASLSRRLALSERRLRCAAVAWSFIARRAWFGGRGPRALLSLS